MALASDPHPDFCGACGWPIGPAEACLACRRPRSPLAVPPARPDPVDVSGLDPSDRLFEAWRKRDYARFLGQLVGAEAGIAARAVSAPNGPGWIVPVRGALVFVALEGQPPEVSLEAPVARLTSGSPPAVLRVALELCARPSAGACLCLRDERLVVAFSSAASALTPQAARAALVEVSRLARDAAHELSVLGSLAPAVPGDTPTWEALGHTRALAPAVRGGPGRVGRDLPPLAAAPLTAFAPRSEPPLMEAPPMEAPVDEPSGVSDSIPPILAFGLAPRAAERPAPAPESPPPRKMSLPEIDIDAVARRATGSGEHATSQYDRLCAVLQLARTLASTTRGHPFAAHWLVRAAVYRAIFEFEKTLPDAVSLLYRSSGVAPRERPVSRGITAPEPPLMALDRILALKGHVPKQEPIAVEPMTTAQQAKDHATRYLAEIEVPAAEPALRHYLAVGALVELLVRAKLPPQTSQRLRDIVAHAQREGPKPQVVSLLVTSLQRIASG